MTFPRTHRAASFVLGIALLSLTFSLSCQPPSPGPNTNTNANTNTSAPNPRDELIRSLKGANVDGYFFRTKEDNNQVITSLINNTLGSPVKLDSSNRLVIGYANVKDKKANTTKTLKAEIVKDGEGYSLRVEDIVAGGLVIDERFAPRLCPGVPVFDTFDQCIDDFNCKVLPELQCEANRTCKTIRTELRCCMRDGTEIHALILIVPTSIRCIVAFPFDIDTILVKP